MKLIGQNVKHKIFGNGQIKSIKGDFISVDFGGELKKFAYPSCFEKFLELDNKYAKKKIEYDLDISKGVNSNNKHKVSKVNESTGRGRTIKNSSIIRFNNIEEFCDKYAQQINREIAYLYKNGNKKITVYDGKFIGKQGKLYFYEFETDTELNYQNGTLINIYVKSNVITEEKGTLENCFEFTVIISTEIDLGHSENTEINSLEFSVEAWRLLKSLDDRLTVLKIRDNEIVNLLVSDGLSQIEYGQRIKTGQDTAVKMSLSQKITFIWGPPGTGKTETLAKIALHHMAKGNKVLMLSYSNVSVDGAIQRVFKLSEQRDSIYKIKKGDVLRYGYPKDKDILNSADKTTFQYVLNKNSDLFYERDLLIKDQKKYSRTDPKYREISKRIQEIRKKLRNEEIEAIADSKFIATTVSKSVVDLKLTDIPFDVVIFDEASMSYIPQIVFGASLAKKHFICMGDFCQLPPIVQSENAQGLSTDIFRYCGIYDAVQVNANHKWLCMLDTQYRMHPDIAEVASNSMYNGLLKTGLDNKKIKEREKIGKLFPKLNKAFGLADLSFMMSTCIPMKDHSRVNVLSAFISFALAQCAYEDGFATGVISPYSTQAGLLNSMSLDFFAYKNIKPSELKNIPCSTVHQFQGSEKDVIIYDATDCYREAYPGILITGMKDNYANRLFNVAMTRAKGKFIAVTNAKFMVDKGIKNDLMFGSVIEKAKFESYLDGHQLEYIDCGNDTCIKFYKQNDCYTDFLKDLKDAKNSIYMDIPDKPMNDTEFFEKLIDIFNEKKKKSIKIVVRAEKRSSIPQQLLPYTIEHKFSMNPIVVIDKTISWYGIPLSEAEFKTENGNIQTKYYPIIRFVGRKTARKLYGLLELNNTSDETSMLLKEEEPHTFAQWIVKNKKCVICGKAMQMKKSKKGKFFLSCSNYPRCDGKEWITQSIVDEYLYVHKKGSNLLVARCQCPKCGRSIESKTGRYGLYLQCCGLDNHKFKFDEI